MKCCRFLLFLVFLMGAITIEAQSIEYDDVYFSSKDRDFARKRRLKRKKLAAQEKNKLSQDISFFNEGESVNRPYESNEPLQYKIDPLYFNPFRFSYNPFGYQGFNNFNGMQNSPFFNQGMSYNLYNNISPYSYQFNPMTMNMYGNSYYDPYDPFNSPNYTYGYNNGFYNGYNNLYSPYNNYNSGYYNPNQNFNNSNNVQIKPTKVYRPARQGYQSFTSGGTSSSSTAIKKTSFYGSPNTVANKGTYKVAKPSSNYTPPSIPSSGSTESTDNNSNSYSGSDSNSNNNNSNQSGSSSSSSSKKGSTLRGGSRFKR